MEFYDVNVMVGESFARSFVFKNVDGSVRDLSGCVGACQVRAYPGFDELLAEMVVEVDGVNGTVRVELDESVTEGFSPGIYSWDLRLDEGGVVTYYVGGKFGVMASVTRG